MVPLRPYSSSHSRSSASNTLLTASCSAGTRFPTSVVERMSSTVRPHTSPARRSRTPPPPALPPPSLLPHLCPQGFLLFLPLRANNEEALPSLVRAPAPPALRGRPILRSIEVLPGQTVPRLELVEPRGKPLGAPGYRAVRLLPFRHPVLCLGGPAPSPLARFCPLLLGDLPLEVGKRSWERQRTCSRPVRVTQPFHPAGVWLPRRNFRPLIRLLVAFHPFVSRAPSDLNDDSRPSAPQCSNILPSLERVR